MALPLLPLIALGAGALSSGVSAYQGKKSRGRLKRFEQEQFGRNLGMEAERDSAGEIAALRQRGEAGEKQAFRSGLLDAASRGVAAGVGPANVGGAPGAVGAVSGLAQQQIDPRIADVRANTQASIMEAIARRRKELEDARAQSLSLKAQEEAARPRGVFGALFG